MKKLIAIVIALVMCLSVLPVMASASMVYIIAGTEGLCGTAWDTNNSSNMMLENLDGTFTFVYPDVPVGTHEFKVTDGTWDQSWPSSNYVFEITAVCDVTINFNPADGSVTATGDHLQIPAPSASFSSITVAGTAGICGTDWDVANVANNMTANGSVYTITYYGVAAGDHKFKFAANSGWTDNWGVTEGTAVEYGVAMDAVYNAQDINLSLSQASDVTLTLDLTNFDATSKGGAKFTVTVSASTGSAPVESQPAGGNEQPDASGNITVYAYVPDSWTAPRAWVWERVSGVDTPVFSAWPGEAMTKGDNGWWYIEVPANINYVIINDGGSGQTADLEKIEPGDCWVPVTVVNGAISGEVLSYEPSLEDVVPPTTQAPETQAPTTQAPTTQAPTTQAPATSAPTEPGTTEPGNNGGVDAVTIVVAIVLIAAAGAAGYFVTKAVISKKK